MTIALLFGCFSSFPLSPQQADDHKCTHSFAQRPGTEPYTCGAQLSPVTKTMFAVRGGSTLISWKADHTDSHTVKLPEEAAHMVVHRAVKGAVIVLRSGRLAVYSDTCSAIHTPSDPLLDLPPSAVPVWASVAPNPAGALVFVLLQSPSSPTATLALYLINTSGVKCVLQHTFSPSTLPPKSAGANAGAGSTPPSSSVTSATLSSASFHSGSNVLCLLWTRLNGNSSGAQWESHQFGETGRWYMSPPIVDCVRQIVTPPLTIPDSALTLPEKETRKKKRTRTSKKTLRADSAPKVPSQTSGAPDPSLFAVSPTISLIVVPTSNSFFLSAWDVTHGVVLASTKVLRVTASDADRPAAGTRLSVSVALSPDRSRIVLLLSGGHGVPVLIPVAIGSSDLATCLGQMKNTRRWLTAPPTVAPSTLTSEALHTVRAGTPSVLANIIAAPPSHSVERSAVVRCLKELRAAHSAAASSRVPAPSKKKARRKADSKAKDKDKDKDKGKGKDGGFGALFIKLLRRRTVSAIANPTLIPTILHCQRLDLLEYALLTISDIPEASLVRVIRWLLAGVSPDAVSEFVGAKCRHYQHEAPPSGTTAHMATTRHFLCIIVAYKWNPLFLEHCLKQLVLSEVTVVLQVVLRLLRKLVSGPAAKHLSWKPAVGDATSPTVGDVLEFVSVVVDAHVTPLVLGSANDSRVETILKTLKQLVDLELKLCDSLEAVHGYAEFVTKKLPLPISPVPDYSVEFLEL